MFKRLQDVQVVQQLGGIMQVRHFEDLEIWRRARELTREIYRLTEKPQFRKDFGLKTQLERAAISVMSNIAEGFERGGNQEFAQFLYIAKGSCGEVRSQLYVALDQHYVEFEATECLMSSLKRLSVMISHLIDHLKNGGMKGAKYGSSVRSVVPKQFERIEHLERLEQL